LLAFTRATAPAIRLAAAPRRAFLQFRLVCEDAA